MYNPYIATEWLKSKRTNSRHLMLIGPIIFIAFCYFMTLLMGSTPEGKSFLMAVAFNWYPSIILPIFVSIFIVSIVNRDRPVHQVIYKVYAVDRAKVFQAKHFWVLVNVACVIFIASILLYLVNFILIKDVILVSEIIYSSLMLWVGILPLIATGFLLSRLLHPILVHVVLFMLSFIPAAILANSSYWVYYPWCYVMRLMAITAKVHPNGTFLPPSHPMLASYNLYLGVVLSLLAYMGLLWLDWSVYKRRSTC
ncbi:ABC transporter permease [Facklamia lactis]|uniref:ABC transporter permease n=1 Tax=Facklamia lactis TaxID=2749967 RepID=UPI0018CD1D4C|nr:ABC transporter permease [Facklamia lactis]MBG9981107.1 hypothetical protein [Facklamia lactis]